MAVTHGYQSPAYSLPSFAQKQRNTLTWGSGGNTLTISDDYIKPNSFVIVRPYGSTPAAGNWVTSAPTLSNNVGSVTVTSSQSENSTLDVEYIVL